MNTLVSGVHGPSPGNVCLSRMPEQLSNSFTHNYFSLKLVCMIQRKKVTSFVHLRMGF